MKQLDGLKNSKIKIDLSKLNEIEKNNNFLSIF